MSQFKEGNDLIMNVLFTSRRFYANQCRWDEYKCGWLDGQLMMIVVYIGVDHYLYQGVENEIRFLQRRAAKRNGSLP